MLWIVRAYVEVSGTLVTAHLCFFGAGPYDYAHAMLGSAASLVFDTL